ncbi:DUF6773 family protein [Mycoplasmatota bacterium WC44]
MKNKDERVVLEQRKIAREAFQLVSMFLLVSILYKHLVLDYEFNAYMVEYFALCGSVLYIIFRKIYIGMDINNEKSRLKTYLINSLFLSILYTIGIIIDEKDFSAGVILDGILGFFVAYIITLLIQLGLNFLSKKRADKLIKELEEDNE